MLSVDNKIAALGFRKVYESERSCHYERYDAEHGFYQTVYIQRRTVWNEFRIQSYDENLMDKKGIGNTCVALTIEETKLFYKKMKQMTRKFNKLLKNQRIK